MINLTLNSENYLELYIYPRACILWKTLTDADVVTLQQNNARLDSPNILNFFPRSPYWAHYLHSIDSTHQKLVSIQGEQNQRTVNTKTYDASYENVKYEKIENITSTSP